MLDVLERMPSLVPVLPPDEYLPSSGGRLTALLSGFCDEKRILRLYLVTCNAMTNDLVQVYETISFGIYLCE